MSWAAVVLVCLVGAATSIGLSHFLEGYPALVKPLGENPPLSHLTPALLAEGGRSALVASLGIRYLRTRGEADPGIGSFAYAVLFAAGTAWLLWMFWLIAGGGLQAGQARQVSHVALLVLGCLLASVLGKGRDSRAVGGRAWKETSGHLGGDLRY